jgi:hypothetical protein
MLNIPQKLKVVNEVSASKLEQLIELRNKVNQLEQLIEQIMPLAIDEAIDILSNESAINGKNLVYAQKGKGKITINFRKQYPSIRDYVVLQRLDEEIKAEQKSLVAKHQTQLSDLEQKLNQLNGSIELLETEKEKLMTNKRLINLKKRFSTERDNGMELIPSLAVYLDK